jgi:cytochrome c oxidase cbb3-type subunit I/II
VARGDGLDGGLMYPNLPRTNLGLVFSSPFVLTMIALGGCYLMASENIAAAMVGVVILLVVTVAAAFQLRATSQDGKFRWHATIETRPMAFSVLVLLAVAAGGIVQLLPGIIMEKKAPLTADGSFAVALYTPLELEGRDIYVSEGCYVCHSQMIRPFRDEYLRYGEPSRIEESMWDHPFQWGSKRTGPDLARIGEGVGPRSPNAQWHFQHLMDPQSTSAGSNMPAYQWLATDKVALENTPAKIKAMRTLGVPYEAAQVDTAKADYEVQARKVVADLAELEVEIDWDAQMVALIAYLTRLGRNDLVTEVSSTTGGR